MNKRLITIFIVLVLLVFLLFGLNYKFHIGKVSSEVLKNQRGNTLGNIEGFAGQKGDWIYYVAVPNVDVPDIHIFCRENIKNGKKQKLSNDSVRNVNLLGDWVYFNTNEPEGVGPIYRMKFDGSQKQKLNNDESGFINVVENFIYYINYSDGSKIYRMKLDGSEREKLNNDVSWSINVTNGWIYYASGKNIYKLSIDGGIKKLILSEDVGLMTVDKDWIYFFNGVKSKLFKVTLDGTSKKTLTDDIINKFNIVEDYIYYSVSNDITSNVYRIDLDGKNKIKIAAGSVGSIIGDWIYYYDDYAEFQVPTRMKLDGTFCEILSLE